MWIAPRSFGWRFVPPLLLSLAFVTVMGGRLFQPEARWQPGVYAASVPSDDRTIAHVLNRIGFGPRPGDIEKVRRIGVMAYLDRQLHPERIDDGLVQAKLSRLKTLTMSTSEIAREYFIPALMARRERKREQAQQAGKASGEPDASRDSETSQLDPGRRNHNRTQMATGPGLSDPAFPGEAPSGERLPEALRKQRQVTVELTEQKLLRAVYSERQLQEVLVDFWFNHFNVFGGKGLDRILLTEYERDTIRPNVFGKFRDLLGRTAESPAMLFYLDNWMSADPTGPHLDHGDGRGRPGAGALRRGRRPGFGPGRPGRAPGEMTDEERTARVEQPPQGRKKGLNENYARELMELHTLGVDGGYTQTDIVEVARALTGWTISRPGQGGGDLFRFDPRIHDPGEKGVLGHVIKAGGGKEDGEQVLDILARHPSTARFIATKLSRRFVSDDPPKALVERASARFMETDGDLREVVRTIITSPEFFAPRAYRAKVKTPLEFVASALRITGARIDSALGVARTLQQLGMPLYFCQPPTGYSDRADAWVNTGALINRMNFALALAGNRIPGVTADLGLVFGSEQPSLDTRQHEKLVETILQNDASEATIGTLRKTTELTELAALTLGAPEFQRR